MIYSTLWIALYVAWFGSEVYIGIKTRTRRGGGDVQDRGSLLILWIVIAGSITACEWIRATHPPSMFAGAPWLRIAAVFVLSSGLAIRWTAVITLGRSFSSNVAILESQRIHKSGLYSLVRHPSYSGLLLIFLAIGLHSRNWISMAFVLIPTTASLLYRIHVEEDALRRAFGEEYLSYSRNTRRLIPGIY